MMAPFLAEPSEKYKESYLQLMRERLAEGRQRNDDLDKISRDFLTYLRWLRDQESPATVEPGRIPNSEYWLVEGDEVIGRLSLRHWLDERLRLWGGHIGYEISPRWRRRGYGKEILRLGLEKAREQGMRRVLVTCDEDNIGSKKIIEANGGRFENAMEVPESPVRKLRYWIDIS